MKTGTKTMLIAGVTFGLLLGAQRASAQEETQPLPEETQPPQEETQIDYRCENAKMQADASELLCLDRCQRKAQRRSASVRTNFLAVCADDCHQRCEDRKKKVEIGPKCVDKQVQADPRRCAAKQFAALAQLNLCLASCTGESTGEGDQRQPSVDELACDQHCNERLTMAQDRLNESSVCAQGGIPDCVVQ